LTSSGQQQQALYCVLYTVLFVYVNDNKAD